MRFEVCGRHRPIAIRATASATKRTMETCMPMWGHQPFLVAANRDRHWHHRHTGCCAPRRAELRQGVPAYSALPVRAAPRPIGPCQSLSTSTREARAPCPPLPTTDAPRLHITLVEQPQGRPPKESHSSAANLLLSQACREVASPQAASKTRRWSLWGNQVVQSANDP